jgi:large repetitive protein
MGRPDVKSQLVLRRPPTALPRDPNVAYNRSLQRRRLSAAAAVLTIAAGALTVGTVVAPVAQAVQPVPGHTKLVPDVPRKGTPRISTGEIWDIEVVPQLNRVFIAGSFTAIQNTTGVTTSVPQRYLASYNLTTGLIDTSFRPTFDGTVTAVEATPDGTKLFVAGTFKNVNGVARQKVASLNLTTGAPVASFAFTKSTDNAATALAATNSTLYVGGRFSRINGQLRTGLAAVNVTTGAVDMTFDNQLSGGIGVNGALTVQQLKLTHDETKLLVVHTGRQIHGQDRLGIGLIDTATKQLLPWRTRLWDENLARVGGVQRIYGADIAPNDQYFVVTSGSGGDAPPISDTAVAFPVAGADNVQPKWVARCFDSVYSVAITEQAVYIGGHFSWNESPTANQPWPGLNNVGYGTGQGLSGYGLGDQVVGRYHLGALDPATGTALEWGPISDSFEGNKAMEATPRGLLVGGDGMYQGGINTGRVAFYDFNSVPAPGADETTITAPIEGRVIPTGTPFVITGQATAPGRVKRVQVEVVNRATKKYLQDDGVSWGASNNFYATLATTNATSTSWSLPLTLTAPVQLQITAKTFDVAGGSDATKATKKIETFNFDDQTPTTTISGPSTSVLASTSFTMTGTATDDHGVQSLIYYFKDDSDRYLQDDGSVSPIYNTFRGAPDVIGATSATWSYAVTVPAEGVWTGSAIAVDTAGQSALRSSDRSWTINSNAIAPAVTISQPVVMTPPFSVPSVIVSPGSPLTFSGTASDDNRLANVNIVLWNSTTRENLGADGSWGVGVALGYHRISGINLNVPTYNWSYTTPFNLSPGTYTFAVFATDNDGLSTSTANAGILTVLAQVAGDSPPNGTVSVGGTQSILTPHVDLAGSATDDIGVSRVEVAVYDNDSGRYLQDDGTASSTYNTLLSVLAAPGSVTTDWSLPINLPASGDYSVTAYAYDTAGQQDVSTTGATARYRYYPNDLPPVLDPALSFPITGAAFTQGKIVVSGRANDDVSIAKVEVAIVNSAGQYLNSAGAFTSTTASWRTAFLNSPGSPGSNFAYTSPVIPDGAYTVLVQPTDLHGQVGASTTATGVTVTHPANLPPVAHATFTCVVNVCTFDGRTSTDENAPALTYAWNFGNGTGTGPLPSRTYTAAGPYTVTLTVRDEWNLTSTTTLTVPMTEPAGNVAPVPTFITSCLALACGTSSTGTVDANVSDVITYSWNWGDGTALSTGTAPSHTYAVQGAYTVTLTTTDGWGKSNFTTRAVNLAEPLTNHAPTVVFNASCLVRTCTMVTAGTTDPDGDAIRYSWNFGDGTATSTSASPQHVYTAAGTYTVTVTVTDGWGKFTTVTRTVTLT